MNITGPVPAAGAVQFNVTLFFVALLVWVTALYIKLAGSRSSTIFFLIYIANEKQKLNSTIMHTPADIGGLVIIY